MKRGKKCMGAWADGGRQIKGPGDGRSDSVKANGGKARLSRDEYVIPADVVSALGRGSSEAGADMLDKMVMGTRKQWGGQMGAFPAPNGSDQAQGGFFLGGIGKAIGGALGAVGAGPTTKLTGYSKDLSKLLSSGADVLNGRSPEEDIAPISKATQLGQGRLANAAKFQPYQLKLGQDMASGAAKGIPGEVENSYGRVYNTITNLPRELQQGRDMAYNAYTSTPGDLSAGYNALRGATKDSRDLSAGYGMLRQATGKDPADLSKSYGMLRQVTGRNPSELDQGFDASVNAATNTPGEFADAYGRIGQITNSTPQDMQDYYGLNSAYGKGDPSGYYQTNQSAQNLIGSAYDPKDIMGDANIKAALGSYDRGTDIGRAAMDRRQAGKGAFGTRSDVAAGEFENEAARGRGQLGAQLAEQGIDRRVAAAQAQTGLAQNELNNRLTGIDRLNQSGLQQRGIGLEDADLLRGIGQERRGQAFENADVLTGVGERKRGIGFENAAALNQQGQQQRGNSLENAALLTQQGQQQRNNAFQNAGALTQQGLLQRGLSIDSANGLQQLGTDKRNMALDDADLLRNIGLDRRSLTLSNSDVLRGVGQERKGSYIQDAGLMQAAGGARDAYQQSILDSPYRRIQAGASAMGSAPQQGQTRQNPFQTALGIAGTVAPFFLPGAGAGAGFRDGGQMANGAFADGGYEGYSQAGKRRRRSRRSTSELRGDDGNDSLFKFGPFNPSGLLNIDPNPANQKVLDFLAGREKQDYPRPMQGDDIDAAMAMGISPPQVRMPRRPVTPTPGPDDRKAQGGGGAWKNPPSVTLPIPPPGGTSRQRPMSTMGAPPPSGPSLPTGIGVDDPVSQFRKSMTAPPGQRLVDVGGAPKPLPATPSPIAGKVSGLAGILGLGPNAAGANPPIPPGTGPTTLPPGATPMSVMGAPPPVGIGKAPGLGAPIPVSRPAGAFNLPSSAQPPQPMMRPGTPLSAFEDAENRFLTGPSTLPPTFTAENQPASPVAQQGAFPPQPDRQMAGGAGADQMQPQGPGLGAKISERLNAGFSSPLFAFGTQLLGGAGFANAGAAAAQQSNNNRRAELAGQELDAQTQYRDAQIQNQIDQLTIQAANAASQDEYRQAQAQIAALKAQQQQAYNDARIAQGDRRIDTTADLARQRLGLEGQRVENEKARTGILKERANKPGAAGRTSNDRLIDEYNKAIVKAESEDNPELATELRKTLGNIQLQQSNPGLLPPGFNPNAEDDEEEEDDDGGLFGGLFREGGRVGRDKVGQTMKEWKAGKLHSGSKNGPKVKSRRQALAIGLNQSRRGAF